MLYLKNIVTATNTSKFLTYNRRKLYHLSQAYNKTRLSKYNVKAKSKLDVQEWKKKCSQILPVSNMLA